MMRTTFGADQVERCELRGGRAVVDRECKLRQTVVMKLRSLPVVLCAAACGDVARAPDDGAVVDQMVGTTTYKGHIEMTPPVDFGGLPFCDYTMTLQQVDIELMIEASGAVRSGKVQDLNLEAVVLSDPPCPVGPIPPKIASYTFVSASPGTDGTTLTFAAAPTNEPDVEVTATLTSAGAVKTAKLGFQRINVDDVLAWTIAATATLTAR